LLLAWRSLKEGQKNGEQKMEDKKITDKKMEIKSGGEKHEG